MKIKTYLSKCKEVLIVECDGEPYPFDADKDILSQAFELSLKFATKHNDAISSGRFKKDKLVLSVNLPDKIASRACLRG